MTRQDNEAWCCAPVGPNTRSRRSPVERLLPSGRVVLYRVISEDQVIGIFYGFVERNAIYHYRWGLSRFDDNALSPGFVVRSLCMQEALERGYDEVSWLAGDVRYKRELSTATKALVWAEWQRGPWISLINGVIEARHWLQSRSDRTSAPVSGDVN